LIQIHVNARVNVIKHAITMFFLNAMARPARDERQLQALRLDL
jgi:hypothetical protein